MIGTNGSERSRELAPRCFPAAMRAASQFTAPELASVPVEFACPKLSSCEPSGALVSPASGSGLCILLYQHPLWGVLPGRNKTLLNPDNSRKSKVKFEEEPQIPTKTLTKQQRKLHVPNSGSLVDPATSLD